MAALAMAAFTGSASAISTDGDYTDWFSVAPAVALDFNNWDDSLVTILNANYRTQVDPDDDAFGGQDYDVEQIFYYFDDADINDPNSGGKLHIGLVTGFDGLGEFPTNQPAIYAGDMFIDLGATGTYTIAVGTGLEVGGRAGQAWINNGWTELDPTIMPDHAYAVPYRVDETAGGVIAHSATVAWGTIGTIAGRRNFLEIEVDILDFMEDSIAGDAGKIGLHWTMSCGNDDIDVIDSTPFVPVPEPATMMLLGMGVLGMALRSRKPNC